MTIDSHDLPNNRIIAIDGTSGSGKSTIARGLGAILELDVFETGSLYRATTLLCLRANADVDNEDSVLDVVSKMNFQYNGVPTLDGIDISDEIKNHEIVMNVSHVSVHPQVRSALTQIMRQWIREHDGGVVEGRDITTVVAPQAVLQIFIDAPAEVRAMRRASDPKDNINNLSESEIAQGIAYRDSLDSTRAASPLKRAQGVWEIDSSLMNPEEIIAEIANAYNSQL